MSAFARSRNPVSSPAHQNGTEKGERPRQPGHAATLELLGCAASATACLGPALLTVLARSRLQRAQLHC